MPWKRIGAIVGFLALVALFATLLYLLFFRPAPAPPINEAGLPPGGALPQVGPGAPRPATPPATGLPKAGELPGAEPSERAQGGLTTLAPLVPTDTIDATVGPDGSTVRYYRPTDGRFYRVTPEGAVETLADQVFYNVSQVTWSPSRQAAVLEYPDGSNIVYDFQAKSQVTLPRHWQEFSFDPDGQRLAFKSLGLDRESRWLAVSDVDGGQSQAIEPLGDNERNVIVTWSPNRQVVALNREVKGTDRQEVFFIGLHGENFRSLEVPGLGLQTQWTPDGRALLYSVASPLADYRPLLWVAEASGESIGENRRSLGLNTWADKCAFSGATTVVCAVPRELPSGAGLAPNVADGTPDDLYEVNLATGQHRLLAIPATPVTAASVMVTNDRQWVVLEEKITGQLYRIKL